MTLTKNISKNSNIKNNPVTTLLGFIFVFSGLGLFIVPMLHEVKSNIEWYIPASLTLLGAVLIVSPDDFLSIVKKGTNKITKDETKC